MIVSLGASNAKNKNLFNYYPPKYSLLKLFALFLIVILLFQYMFNHNGESDLEIEEEIPEIEITMSSLFYDKKRDCK